MKIVAFILSIYFLALNFSPCEDKSVVNDELETEISQTIGDDHNHEDSNLCSPFCVCQCCHISATYFQIVDLKLDFTYISTQDFLYLNGSEEDFTTSILQPPRA